MWRMPKWSASRVPCVPFPAPGGASSISRTPPYGSGVTWVSLPSASTALEATRRLAGQGRAVGGAMMRGVTVPSVTASGPFVPWLAHPLPTTEAPRGGDGPLRGRRLAVKDLVDVAGLPTGAGHPRWLATHAVPGRSAPVVDRLTGAGAVIVGKAHTDEFAYSMFGSNAHYGTPENPRAPGHLPGGSSSGPAVAVAAGMADVGLGTDTAGSVRIPASWCGLYGLRPSHERVSRTGIVPLAESFDVAGPICADLDTLRRAAIAMLSGPALAERPRRLLVPPDLWALADPAVREALRPAVDALGAHLPTDDRPAFGAASAFEADGPRRDYVRAFAVVQGREFWRNHGPWITEHRPDFGPGVGARVRAAAARTDAEAAEARGVLAATRAALEEIMAGSGVLVLPTTPVPAPPRTPTGVPELRQRMLALTTLASLARLPALSIPAGELAGRPVGLCLLGPVGSDEHLLDLAATLA
jgi:amidase